MTDLLQLLDARLSPTHIVVEDAAGALSWQALRTRVLALAARLHALRITRVALHADNTVAWLVVDLACQHAQVPCIPLPLFFTDTQCSHVLQSAGVDAIFTARPDAFTAPGQFRQLGDEAGLSLLRRETGTQAELPRGTGKLTFTSGSTGTPKGVCLSTVQQLQQAEALARAVAIPGPRHLCILPLGVLLENIAGVYAPLLAGGTVLLRPLAELGFEGSSLQRPTQLLKALQQLRPDTLILLPHLLQFLVQATASGWQAPPFRFLAVGGARVAASLVNAARALGLPVYEGYGLSECVSVVSLNTPAADQPGSCGTALPHAHIAERNGELIISGNLMLDYLGDRQSWYPREFATGDLGRVDEAGFVHIEGRRKNLLISGYGRNIAPEWVESELLASLQFRDAVLVGDGRPWCSALLYPFSPRLDERQIQQVIDRVNVRLPDYARVRGWLRLPAPLAETPALLTANGRPRRDAINHHYAEQIAALYPDSLSDSHYAHQEARP